MSGVTAISRAPMLSQNSATIRSASSSCPDVGLTSPDRDRAKTAAASNRTRGETKRAASPYSMRFTNSSYPSFLVQNRHNGGCIDEHQAPPHISSVNFFMSNVGSGLPISSALDCSL